jgi:hypothetical protein
VNPFFFEIVRGRYDRYSWQLVTYLGGDREVIARSSRDWGSERRARKAAKATKNAACSARVVSAPPRPGDIRFEVVRDVLALTVGGDGDTDRNGHHAPASRPAAARQAEAAQAPAPAPAGAKQSGTPADAAGTAPHSNGEAGSPDSGTAPAADATGSEPETRREVQPKAPPRRPTTRTKAAAARG